MAKKTVQELVECDHTLLVIHGKPYKLVYEKDPADNDVCGKCDLLADWCSNLGGCPFMDLCTSWDDREGAFFVLDYALAYKKVSSYMNHSEPF